MYRNTVIPSLICRCALSKKKKDRLLCAAKLLKWLENEKGELEDLIDKLVTAGNTIRDQNELLECFYTATGNRTGDIINTWKTMKKIEENKLKRED